MIRKSDRIIAVKFALETNLATIISLYALQVGCAEDMKNRFRQDMDEVMLESTDITDLNSYVKKKK